MKERSKFKVAAQRLCSCTIRLVLAGVRPLNVNIHTVNTFGSADSAVLKLMFLLRASRVRWPPVLLANTVIRRITTFRSTTDRMYVSGPTRL